MLKIQIILLVFLTSFLFSQEKSYVFEAKGQFAEDLKQLIQKYSNEGKIEAKVYEKKSDTLSTLFSQSQEFNGQEIYMSKCASCHGKKGEISPSFDSRKLQNMSREEIEQAFYNYKTNDSYGGVSKTTMQLNVIAINDSKLTSIIDYLKNKDIPKTQKTQKKPTEQKTSYLQ